MPFATQNQLNSLEIHKKIKEEPPMTIAHYLVTVHLNIDLPLALLQPEPTDAFYSIFPVSHTRPPPDPLRDETPLVFLSSV